MPDEGNIHEHYKIFDVSGGWVYVEKVKERSLNELEEVVVADKLHVYRYRSTISEGQTIREQQGWFFDNIGCYDNFTEAEALEFHKAYNEGDTSWEPCNGGTGEAAAG